MTTLLSPVVASIEDRVHAHLKRERDGGSVPNIATELEHSYHRSFEDSPHDDGYSVHYWGDKHFPGRQAKAKQYAAAADFSLPADLMIRYTARFLHLAKIGSPLVWGVREFAGTLDGDTVYAYDLTSKVRTYGWDNSHLWHIHVSFNRRVILDPRLARVAEVFAP